MGADHALGWFGFKAVPDFCNCGSHIGALVGAVCGWCLLWKSDPVVGTLVVRLELGLELWLVSVLVSTPGQSMDAMEVQSVDAMEVQLDPVPLCVHVVVAFGVGQVDLMVNVSCDC